MCETITELAAMLSKPGVRDNRLLVVMKANEGFSTVWVPNKVYGKLVGRKHHNASTITGAIQKAISAKEEATDAG